jgi:quercetin dioxygenase-like cupin family protein
MAQTSAQLHRWDEIALEKVTEMLSRKSVTGEREMLVQIYVKRGCMVPIHAHESEQMTYVLQGALRFLVGGEEITVREGEVLHIPSGIEHQAEALEDTFELDFFQSDQTGARPPPHRAGDCVGPSFSSGVLRMCF